MFQRRQSKMLSKLALVTSRCSPDWLSCCKNLPSRAFHPRSWWTRFQRTWISTDVNSLPLYRCLSNFSGDSFSSSVSLSESESDSLRFFSSSVSSSESESDSSASRFFSSVCSTLCQSESEFVSCACLLSLSQEHWISVTLIDVDR